MAPRDRQTSGGRLHQVEAATPEMPLARQLELAQARIASLERRMAQQKATNDSLKGDLSDASKQLEAAEARCAKLEKELAGAQEATVLCENKALSLRTSLDLISAENSRLQSQIRLSGSMLEDLSAQARSLWGEAAASEMKRVTHMKEAERYRAEAEAKDVLLDAAKSRAELAERLCGEARERLALQADEEFFSTRKFAELTNICRNRGRELVELQETLLAKQLRINELEEAWRQLAAATNALLTSYQNHRSERPQKEVLAVPEVSKHGDVVIDAPRISGAEVQDSRRSQLIKLASELTKLHRKRQLAA